MSSVIVKNMVMIHIQQLLIQNLQIDIKRVCKVNTVVFIKYDMVLTEHQLHYDDALQVSNTFDIKFKPVLHDVMDQFQLK